MAATITQTSKPLHPRALDTSGNNNHGQIYSGRGLEFDGVSDKLTVTTGTDFGSIMDTAGSYSVACWVYIESYADNSTGNKGYNIFGHKSATANRSNLTIGEAGEVSHAVYMSKGGGANAYYHASGGAAGVKILELKTWYRIICVQNAGTEELYINGIKQTGNGITYSSPASSQSSGLYIGEAGGDNDSFFDGKLSNFQIWNATWSASDALYDYLNPEQLALNNGGTSLTESNLKLWYPMQDGHRGQQSYILDGANTGLGVERVLTIENDTGGFPLDELTDNGGGSYTGTYSSGSGYKGFEQPSSETFAVAIGEVYKLTFNYTNVSDADDLQVFIGNDAVGSSYSTPSTFMCAEGDNVIYIPITSAYASARLVSQINENSEFTISNISLKAINQKNHATSVFYGDEHALNGDMETFPTLSALNDDTFADSTVAGSQRATMVTEGTINNSGSKSAKVTIDDGYTVGWITYNKTDYIVGRKYRAEVYMRAGGSQTISAFQMFADDSLRGVDGTDGAAITPSESFAIAYVEFVALATTQMINMKFTGTTTHFAFIDDFSIKEIGFASGWTDADQQLDIPQTALQSYNQLAWFDGTADKVTISDHNDFTFGDGDTTDSAFSLSAWIYMNEATDYGIITKGTTEWSLHTGTNDKLYFLIHDDSGSHFEGVASANVLLANKWYHVVATYNGVGGASAKNGMNLYINGCTTGYLADPSIGSYEAMHDTSNDVVLGYRTAYSNGCTTEASIWNKELSLAEVQELYNDGKALDAMVHSVTIADADDLLGYWRNNGLSTWSNLNNPGTHDGTPTSLTETLLLPAGVDSSRDTQGFIMNRQRATNSLNLADGSDTPYVDLGSTSTIADDAAVSFMMWLKPDDVDTNYIMGNGSSHDYLKIHDATNFTFAADNSSATFTVGTMTAREWIHVALVKKASNDTWSLYINGVLNGTASTDTEVLNEPFDYRYIGVGISATANNFRGEIDDFLIYDSELLVDKVLRNYKAGKRSHR